MDGRGVSVPPPMTREAAYMGLTDAAQAIREVVKSGALSSEANIRLTMAYLAVKDVATTTISEPPPDGSLEEDLS